jgi:hypothetical protein
LALPQEDRWLDSLRASRRRRFEEMRARRRRLTRNGGGSALLAAMTLAAGGALAADSPQRPAKVLKAGSGGPSVAALQSALGVSADGIFGPVTRRAVRGFQRSRGLVVDGIAGPATLAALGLPVAATVPTARDARARRAGALLERIAACESGGDPTAVSADGRYRGKYQFARATWRGLGGAGDPAQAPEAEQDRLAAKLLAQAGTSPWPNCA